MPARSTAHRLAAAWLGVVTVAAGAWLTAGCGEADHVPPPRALPVADSGSTTFDSGDLFGPCSSGATRKCSIVLGVHDGIESCITGQKLCIDGGWSECITDPIPTGNQVTALGSTGAQ